MDAKEQGKQAAAEAAVNDLVKPGMKLGLGTGSTAFYAIKKVAQLFREGKLPGILVVPTSFDTEILCQDEGLPVRTLNDAQIGGCLDFYLDGADEIDPALNCIKGGGAAHLQEKIVCSASRQFVIIADASKKVPHLGTKFPVPLEIHSLARLTVTRAVEAWGARVTLRYGKGKQGPIVTDNGHIILDLVFEKPVDCAVMEARLKALVGVFEVGLFAGRASAAYIGLADGGVEILKRS